MVSGRYRTTIPRDDSEIIALGVDLVKWSETKEEGKIKFSFAQWYTKKGYVREQWKRLVDCSLFRPYYEEAKQNIALNFVDGTINPSISQRYLRLMDESVKEEENAKLKLEYDHKKDLEAFKHALGQDKDEIDPRLIKVLDLLNKIPTDSLDNKKDPQK